MKIAGFIEAKTNIVYVPAMQLFLQGSDYDIDKAYILGSSMSKRGYYYDWSNLFNYTTLQSLEASNELPIPNGITYESNLDSNIQFNNLDLQWRTLLGNLNSENYEIELADANKMQALAQLINAVYNQKSETINIPSTIVDVINLHSSTELEGVRKSEAIKNKIWYLLKKSGQDPRNFLL
jgi:hypothetical protein